MIRDKLLQFSALQLITATALSTNIVDLSVSGQFAGATGSPSDWPIVITADVPLAGPGTSTVEVQVLTSDNSDMSSSDVLGSTGPIPVADFDGSQVAAVLRLPDRVYKQYMSLNYVVANGPMTAGSVSAGIVPDAHQYRTVGRGYDIAAPV